VTHLLGPDAPGGGGGTAAIAHRHGGGGQPPLRLREVRTEPSARRQDGLGQLLPLLPRAGPWGEHGPRPHLLEGLPLCGLSPPLEAVVGLYRDPSTHELPSEPFNVTSVPPGSSFPSPRTP